MDRAMNLHAICAAVIRLYSAFLLISFVWELSNIVFVSDMPVHIPSVIGAAASGLLFGISWIYAAEIASWAIAGRRSVVETGLKLASLIYVLSFTTLLANNAAELIVAKVRGTSMFDIGFRELSYEYTIAGLAMLGLAVVLMASARVVGRLVARAERISELRKEIE
ncbi:MAG: hypothetical protein WD716_13270 [Fimbriimonadaceae bacterium]